jgi:hypothetical protein
MAGLAAEISIVVLSLALFLFYHVWFFGIHGAGLFAKPQGRDLSEDVFHKGRVARIQFADLVCRDNDTIQGIQQNRNGLTGVAFMSATVSILAQKILSNLLDLDKRGQIEAFAVRATILHCPTCSARIVLMLKTILVAMPMLCTNDRSCQEVTSLVYLHAQAFVQIVLNPQIVLFLPFRAN